MGGYVERRICVQLPQFCRIFFPRGFSATKKKAHLQGNPSVGLTMIMGTLILFKKTQETWAFGALHRV
jgi:hypothetical protein